MYIWADVHLCPGRTVAVTCSPRAEMELQRPSFPSDPSIHSCHMCTLPREHLTSQRACVADCHTHIDPCYSRCHVACRAGDHPD